MAAVCSEQHCHEAFHRAEGGAVDHHRTVFLLSDSFVFELEAFGQVVVNLMVPSCHLRPRRP